MSRFQKVLLLKIEHGEKTSEKVYEQSTLIIGRSTDSHIGISDPGVSRNHLEISLKHGRVWLTDMGSANGSFVNGQKIDSKTKVAYHDGEFIHVGSQRVKISISIVEKAFDIKDISTSDLDSNEKENLMTLVNSAHAEADRINHLVKGETDQTIRATEAKINNLISQANFQADQIISTANNNASKIQEDAQRKHSETVLKAEHDAFAATAEVFRKAEQATVDSEEKAKQILIHADKSAQEKYSKSEEEAAQLLQQARLRVKDLRLDWEKEMQQLTEEMTLRNKQKEEDVKLRAEEIMSAADRQKLIVLNQANELFDIAKKEAQERAVQYYAQAEAELKAAQQKSQEILIEAQQEVKILLSTAEQDSLLKKKEILNHASALANQRADEAEALILARTTTADEKLKSFNELISALEKESIIQNDKLNQIKNQLKDNEDQLLKTIDDLDENKKSAENFKNLVSDLTLQRKILLEELTQGKDQLAETMAQRKTAIIEADQVKQDAERLKNQIDNECRDLKDQARKEVEAFKTRENDLLDKRKLEEIKILKELRLQSDRSLNRHKSELVNEFLRLTESHILTFLKPALPQTFNWQDVTQKLQTEVRDSLNEAVYRFTNVETHKESQDITQQKATLFVKRFKKFGLSGTAALALVLAIPTSRIFIFDLFKQDNVNTGAQIFSQQMQTERARRFEPTKSDQWRENYTDALLYTKGYAELKLTPNYQDKWIRDLHEYLYTKLRVDEDSIVKLVSLEAAMVTKLKEEADSIHPDYVDQQVSKMRGMESESVAQMQKLIGSDKKFEQFRKFSEDYYYQEYLKRSPAQTTE